MNRFFKFLAVTVDVLLIIDIASDLCRKWREKKAQTPTTVSETEEGTAYVFCLDISGTISKTDMKAAREALVAFCERMRPTDVMRVYSIGIGAEPLSDYTSDSAQIRSALEGISRRAQKTYLWQGVSMAADDLIVNRDRLPELAQIVVFSDGIDDSDGSISAGAQEMVNAELRAKFRPEFLNRLDEIILFKPLTKENITGIVELQMKDLNRRIASQNLSIRLTDEARNFVIDQAYDPVYGARPLKRYLQRNVETLAAKYILSGEVHEGDTITIDLENGALTARR